MLEQAREALRPTNAIEAVAGPPRRDAPPVAPAAGGAASLGGAAAAPPAPAEAQAVPSPQSKGTPPTARGGGVPGAIPVLVAGTAQNDAPSLPPDPEEVRRRYYAQTAPGGGERRYYDDYLGKALAFRADAARVSTKREDLDTIKAMLEVAASRGWSEVRVSGTGAFRREAWIEATSRGVSALGHKASELDAQEAERRRAQRAPPDRGNPAGASPPPASRPDPAAAPRPVGGEVAPVAPAPTGQPERQQRPTGDAPPEAPPSGPEPPPPPVRIAFPSASPPVGGAALAAEAALSPDAKAVLRLLTAKIDGALTRFTDESRAELRGFAAAELLEKERRNGPVALTPEQRLAVASVAPAPVREARTTVAPPVSPAAPPSPVREAATAPPPPQRGPQVPAAAATAPLVAPAAPPRPDAPQRAPQPEPQEQRRSRSR